MRVREHVFFHKMGNSGEKRLGMSVEECKKNVSNLFETKKNFAMQINQINQKSYLDIDLSLRSILRVFLILEHFEPDHSYKKYSNKKNGVMI